MLRGQRAPGRVALHARRRGGAGRARRGAVPEFDALLERLRATVDEPGPRARSTPRRCSSACASRKPRWPPSSSARCARSCAPQRRARGAQRPQPDAPRQPAGAGDQVEERRADPRHRARPLADGRDASSVEPREVVALGNRHAELVSDERREVERILSELTREVLRHEAADQSAPLPRWPELELGAGRRALGARDARAACRCCRARRERRGGACCCAARATRCCSSSSALGRLAEVRADRPAPGRRLRRADHHRARTRAGRPLALKSAGLFALCAHGPALPLRAGLDLPALRRDRAPTSATSGRSARASRPSPRT